MKNNFYTLVICFFVLISCTSEKTLREGDLLFKDTQNDNLSTAIKAVTPSGRYSFSHIGIAFFEDGDWKVLEAVPKAGVRTTSLETFKTAPKGQVVKIVVGRLNNSYPYDLQRLIDYAKTQLGKKYDDAFEWNDSAFYCSELVYKMFVNAGQTKAFKPKPMTFKEKGKSTFHPTWIKYYKKLQKPIPEGKLGINPNAMANAESVTLLFEFE